MTPELSSFNGSPVPGDVGCFGSCAEVTELHSCVLLCLLRGESVLQTPGLQVLHQV